MRFRFLCAMILLVFITSLCIAEPTTQPATKPAATQPAVKIPAPPPKGFTAERDILYVPGGDPAQSLDLYFPEKPSEKPLPLIIFVHGGAWWGGNKSWCPAPIIFPEGYAYASFEYRFSRKAKFPAQIQDCLAAVRFLRANAKKYNLDSNRFGAWGSSAGGHLVNLMATVADKKIFEPIGGNEDQSERLQAVIDYYGPTDFTNVMKHAEEDKEVRNTFKFRTKDDPYSVLIGVNLGDDKEKTDAVSPMSYVSKDAAPLLIMHGTADPLVPFAQSVEFYEALKKAGANVVMQKFPHEGHGGAEFDLPIARDLMRRFFDKYLRGIDSKIEALPDEAVTIVRAPATAPATK